MNFEFSKHKKVRIFFEVVICSLFLVFVYIKNGFWFETNDDHIIQYIISGKLTGTPEYHTFVNGVFFTIPLSALYNILPLIPWYGIVLFICYFAFLLLILESILSYTNSWISYFIVIFSCTIIFLSIWYTSSLYQFTSIAILLSASGFLYLYSNNKNIIKYFIFFIVEAVAYSIRPDSMEMVQIEGFAIWFGILVYRRMKNKEVNLKNSIKEFTFPIILSLFIILVGSISFKIAYQSQELKTALIAQDARVEIIDYYGVPSYDEVENIIDEYDITENEYYAYFTYLVLNWDYSKNVLNDIDTYLQMNSKIEHSTIEILKWVYWDSYKSYFWNFNQILVVGWIFIIIILFINFEWSFFPILLSYYFSKGLCWGYLYYKGRIPTRVMLPLYILELFFILMLLSLIIFESNKKRHIKRTISYFIFVFCNILLCFFSYKSGQEQYRYLKSSTESWDLLEKIEPQIAEYCNKDPENKYIVSNSVYSYWKEQIFTTNTSALNNYILGGGWFSSSPYVISFNEEYLKNGSLFYIVAREADPSVIAFQMKYLEELYSKTPILVDSILLETGAYYDVYKIK